MTRGRGLRRPLTLTTRLLAIVVLLVAVTAAAIGTATTVAMRESLDRRLDRDVRASLQRVVGTLGDRERREDPSGFGPDGEGPLPEFGTVAAAFPDAEDPGGYVVSAQGGDAWGSEVALSDGQLQALADDSGVGSRTTDVPGLGGYRIATADLPGGRLVVGLPTSEVDDTIENLVRLELLAALIGVLVAAAVGVVVVRRQLAPLRAVAATAHRVAEQPLAEGEIELRDRVPEDLTDEATEVGQVGAALNTLLDHVESSLSARHRSEQQVRQFVADASHELRTPLSTIRGYAELSRRTPDDVAALTASLTKVSAEADRMTTLVDDLLLLARLDAGRPLADEPVDLTRLLLEAVADARVVGPEHRWRLDLPEAPLELRGDGARLHQVISNLLGNARRHTTPGSAVTVTARRTEGAVELVVADDGPGFPPALVPTAFERFTRADQARSGGGAGLGLSIVAAIVRAHGGTVALESQAGDTRITVRIPASRTD